MVISKKKPITKKLNYLVNNMPQISAKNNFLKVV